MKMYIKPITKTELKKYLSIKDLTQDTNHSIGILANMIMDRMRLTHPNSDVRVYRNNPAVTTEDNYDNLCIKADNISRSSAYTHYIDSTHVLRTHTSAQIPGILRSLAKDSTWSDVLILIPGLAYRRDVTDKKHVGEVHMLDMWRIVRSDKVKVIAKDDLLHVVEDIASVASPGWNLRIIDSPHPYTKQGIEVNAVLGDRDIEILECGLVGDEVMKKAGLDPSVCSGWALGMGLDRLTMTLKNIPDVRYLRSSNPKIAFQMKDLSKYIEVSHQPAIIRDMSYSVPEGYVEEDVNEDIRIALGKRAGILESVEILNETSYKDLPEQVRTRLGISKDQKNLLVRVTLRHLNRSLTNDEANTIYDQVYDVINYGSGGYPS
ncbi:hypothetical protein KBB49_00410 [Candidatus Saccharibacteria bacterium]|nr:hypothetical protein [Candidatus Saccharibacteria bacterium]